MKLKKQKGIILKLNFEKAYDKVDWGFMRQIIERKKFSPKWIDWVRTMVEGGKVAINLNGEIGAYFKSYKGLRQGDPSHPCSSIWLEMPYQKS